MKILAVRGSSVLLPLHNLPLLSVGRMNVYSYYMKNYSIIKREIRKIFIIVVLHEGTEKTETGFVQKAINKNTRRICKYFSGFGGYDSAGSPLPGKIDRPYFYAGILCRAASGTGAGEGDTIFCPHRTPKGFPIPEARCGKGRSFS